MLAADWLRFDQPGPHTASSVLLLSPPLLLYFLLLQDLSTAGTQSCVTLPSSALHSLEDFPSIKWLPIFSYFISYSLFGLSYPSPLPPSPPPPPPPSPLPPLPPLPAPPPLQSGPGSDHLNFLKDVPSSTALRDAV